MGFTRSFPEISGTVMVLSFSCRDPTTSDLPVNGKQYKQTVDVTLCTFTHDCVNGVYIYTGIYIYTGTAGINGLVGLSPPYLLQYSLKNIEQIV